MTPVNILGQKVELLKMYPRKSNLKKRIYESHFVLKKTHCFGSLIINSSAL